MRTRTIGLIVLGAAGVVAYASLLTGSRAARERARTEEPEPTKGSEPPAARARPATPRWQSSAHPPSSQLEEVSASEPAEPLPVLSSEGAVRKKARATAPQPLSDEDLARRASERAMLSRRWETQSTDPRWSDTARIAMLEILEQKQFEPDALRDLDCRSTICRFQLFGRNGEAALELLHAARTLHDDTWVDHHLQDDGTWRIEVFFSRPGYHLTGGDGRTDQAG